MGGHHAPHARRGAPQLAREWASVGAGGAAPRAGVQLLAAAHRTLADAGAVAAAVLGPGLRRDDAVDGDAVRGAARAVELSRVRRVAARARDGDGATARRDRRSGADVVGDAIRP